MVEKAELEVQICDINKETSGMLKTKAEMEVVKAGKEIQKVDNEVATSGINKDVAILTAETSGMLKTKAEMEVVKAGKEVDITITTAETTHLLKNKANLEITKTTLDITKAETELDITAIAKDTASDLHASQQRQNATIEAIRTAELAEITIRVAIAQMELDDRIRARNTAATAVAAVTLEVLPEVSAGGPAPRMGPASRVPVVGAPRIGMGRPGGRVGVASLSHPPVRPLEDLVVAAPAGKKRVRFER